MKKFVLSALFAGLLASNTVLAIDNPCGPENVTFNPADGSATCKVDVVLTESEGKTFAEQTFGIVRSVRFRVDLTLFPGRLDLYLTEAGIQIPAQRINFDIETNGTPIVGSVDIAPKIFIAQNETGVVATDVKLGASRFNSNLPDWIDRVIERKANEAGDKALRKPAEEFVRDQLN